MKGILLLNLSYCCIATIELLLDETIAGLVNQS